MPGKGHRVRPSIGGNTPLNFASSNTADRERSPDNSVVQGQLASQTGNEASSILSLVESSSEHVFIHMDEHDEHENTQPKAQRASPDVSASQESDDRSASEQQPVLVHVDGDELTTPTKAKTTDPSSQDEEEDLHIVIEDEYQGLQVTVHDDEQLVNEGPTWVDDGSTEKSGLNAGVAAMNIGQLCWSAQSFLEEDCLQDSAISSIVDEQQSLESTAKPDLSSLEMSPPEGLMGWLQKTAQWGMNLGPTIGSGLSVFKDMWDAYKLLVVMSVFSRATKSAEGELKVANAYAEKKVTRKFVWTFKEMLVGLVSGVLAVLGVASAGLLSLVAGVISLSNKVLNVLKTFLDGANKLYKLGKGNLGKERTLSSETILKAAMDGDAVALKELEELKLDALLVPQEEYDLHKFRQTDRWHGKEISRILSEDQGTYKKARKELFKKMAST